MNHLIFSAVLSLIVAQILKFAFGLFKEGHPQYKTLWANGSMPSSHSSILATMLVMVGYLEGIDSTLFGIALIFSFLIIGDAMGIRTQTGKQAMLLNKLTVSEEKKPLRELVGHKPTEVIGGIVLGIMVAILYIIVVL